MMNLADATWPLAAFLITVAVVPLLSFLARRIGLVDRPGGRKHHEGNIPLIGGLAVLPVFLALGFGGGFLNITEHWTLLAGALLLLFTGAWDDHSHINPKLKFIVHIMVAFLVVHHGGAQIYTLGDVFGWGEVRLYYLSETFTILAVVLLMNAVNLVDGLDGLSGGKCLVMFGWLMAGAALAGLWPVFWLLAIIVAALAGFLSYNMRHPLRSKASIFMGDAGTLSLGLVLAWFCIDLTQGTDAALPPVSVAWILGLAVIDAIAQLIRRICEGKHPFYADRGHFHHHFVDEGMDAGKATALITAMTFIFGGIGVVPFIMGWPMAWVSILWLAVLAAHIYLSLKPQRYRALLSRLLWMKKQG